MECEGLLGSVHGWFVRNENGYINQISSSALQTSQMKKSGNDCVRKLADFFKMSTIQERLYLRFSVQV